MFGLIYSIFSYGAFLAVFTYFAWFSAGVVVPRSVDAGPLAPMWAAYLVDLGLIALFGLQHSVMARATFKRKLLQILPAHTERATYVLASSAVLAALIMLWRPIPTALWEVQHPALAAVLWAVNVIGWVGVPVSSLMIDHFDLFGVKQALHAFRRTSYERKGFVTPMLYRYVRHPMMLSLLVGLWVTPVMTAGHLLLSLGMSLYIWIGVHFEERALAAELGHDYVRYQGSTPKFLPLSIGRFEDASGRPSSENVGGAT